MLTRPLTVAETHAFLRSAEQIWNEDEKADPIDYLARNPETGDIIPGTGGVRKLRLARAGGGKRGGARVIYYYYAADRPLYLLLAYAKARATDLSQAEKKAAARLAAMIKGGSEGDRR